MISSLTSSACEASATSSSSGGDSVCRLVLAILFNPLYSQLPQLIAWSGDEPRYETFRYRVRPE